MLHSNTAKSALLAAVALVSISVTHAAYARAYTLTDLGLGVATGINNSGQAVLNSNVAGNHAMFWSGGTLTDLAGFPGSSGSQAQGINNDGQAVGFSIVGGSEYATLWNGGVPSNLGALSGSNQSEGYGINDAETVVGSSIFAGSPHATLWSGGSITALDTLGGTYSNAFAINDAGQNRGVCLHLWQSCRSRDLVDRWVGN
jgi:probable HAF family extracellular repeat protein